MRESSSQVSVIWARRLKFKAFRNLLDVSDLSAKWVTNCALHQRHRLCMGNNRSATVIFTSIAHPQAALCIQQTQTADTSSTRKWQICKQQMQMANCKLQRCRPCLVAYGSTVSHVIPGVSQVWPCSCWTAGICSHPHNVEAVHYHKSDSLLDPYAIKSVNPHDPAPPRSTSPTQTWYWGHSGTASHVSSSWDNICKGTRFLNCHWSLTPRNVLSQTAIHSDLGTWSYLSVFWLRQGAWQQVQKGTTWCHP